MYVSKELASLIFTTLPNSKIVSTFLAFRKLYITTQARIAVQGSVRAPVFCPMKYISGLNCEEISGFVNNEMDNIYII